MYTYYKETKTEEHMLYTTEIAELAGTYTLNGKPATALVSAILAKYTLKLDNYEQYYYLSGSYNRKNKVYPKDIYVKAIVEFFTAINDKHGTNIPDKLTARIDDKNYKFTLKIEETI